MCCGPVLMCNGEVLFDLYHHLLPCPLSTTMVRGKALSHDLRWVIVRMHRALTITKIMQYTGLKRRSIERILSIHQKTGGIWPRSYGRRSIAGRNRFLSDDEISVSLSHFICHYLSKSYHPCVVSHRKSWSYTRHLFGWASWCIRGWEWGKGGLIDSMAGSTKEGLYDEKGKYCNVIGMTQRL